MREPSLGKQVLNWEGLYQVTAVAGLYRVTAMVGAGAYYLEDLEEKTLPLPWNMSNLKKYFY